MKNVKFGLCCKFHNQPIKFKPIKKCTIEKLSFNQSEELIEKTLQYNLQQLYYAIKYCAENNIGGYRISSDLFPLYTLDDKFAIIYNLLLLKTEYQNIIDNINKLITDNNIIISCHPDQFTVLNSPKQDVVLNSLINLQYHYKLMQLFNGKIINIHIGGLYNNKEDAMNRFINVFKTLPDEIQNMISIENDDKSFTIHDCLSIAKHIKIKVCMDFHHHNLHFNINQCHQQNIIDIVNDVLKTWNNEIPIFHLSSPKLVLNESNKNNRSHSDLILPEDFNKTLNILTQTDFDKNIILDIEAKHKEVAIKSLQSFL